MLTIIKENEKGNTVLEAVVALAIFSFLVVSVTGVFKMTIEAQRNSLAAKNIQESLRYALEMMSKEIRGAQKNTDNSCGGIMNGRIYYITGNKFRFRNIYDECVIYSINGTTQLQIQRWDPNLENEDDNSYIPITSNDIEISDINFTYQDFVSGSNEARVTIKFTAESASGLAMHKSTTYFQTTISSRYYE